MDDADDNRMWARIWVLFGFVLVFLYWVVAAAFIPAYGLTENVAALAGLVIIGAILSFTMAAFRYSEYRSLQPIPRRR